MKIKKGDNIIVTTGKDKGKSGVVLRTLPAREKVVVEGLNKVTRHQKNKAVRSQGQILEKNMPIHVSNVALLDGKKPARVGYIYEGEGEKKKKIRVFKPSGKKV